MNFRPSDEHVERHGIIFVRLAVAIWLTILILPATVPSVSAAAISQDLPTADSAIPANNTQLIVRFHAVSWSEVVDRLADSGALVIQHLLGLSNTYSAHYANNKQTESALYALRHNRLVAWAEPDEMMHYSFEPDDPLFTNQVWAQSIDLPDAWNITSGKNDVVVAVIDSGVSASHPDLQGKLLQGIDLFNDDDIPEDDVGHGTAVAGIIAARGDDGVGIAGVAMNAMILPVKVGSSDGAPVSALSSGIIWSVDHGAQVLNISLVADQPSDALRDALQYAYDHNVPVVTAAGNEPNSVTYPGSYEQSISVGASTFWGGLASFSSRENRVDLIAPGSGVLSTWWSKTEGDNWKTVSGTSFATPMVSGTLALLLSIDPDLGVEALRNLIRTNALPVGGDNPVPGVGAGQLDAGATIRALLAQSFDSTWKPVDDPVAMGETNRTWIWGPSPIATGFEEYTQAGNGERLIRYYDKARMEITDPLADLNSPWYVTNGLLSMELITGKMQIGDSEFVDRGPAQIVIAGDSGDILAPTYADLRDVLTEPAVDAGALVTQTIDYRGIVSSAASYGDYGVIAARFVPETDHEIASVFWDYLNSQGLVLQDGQLVSGSLFDPIFFATGLPITEAYWTRVLVGGERSDVLVQCFERRCLTYTPSNAPQWQVEMGNVGLHYYRWRYQDVGRSSNRPQPKSVSSRYAWTYM